MGLFSRRQSAEPSSPSHGDIDTLGVFVLLCPSWCFGASPSLSNNERILQPFGLRRYRLRPGPHALPLPSERDLQGECAARAASFTRTQPYGGREALARNTSGIETTRGWPAGLAGICGIFHWHQGSLVKTLVCAVGGLM